MLTWTKTEDYYEAADEGASYIIARTNGPGKIPRRAAWTVECTTPVWYACATGPTIKACQAHAERFNAARETMEEWK